MSVCVVSLDYLCRWQVQVSMYCARRIPAHLMWTQCSILIDICFLPCICLWQTSQIHTCLCVVGPGFVSTPPAFMRSIVSHLTVNRVPIVESRGFRYNLHSSLPKTVVLATPLVGCVVLSHVIWLSLFLPYYI